MQPPLQDMSVEKRAKILEAARSRFLYYGVSKTTMRDIANDLGIVVSNLYCYFKNKEDIVFAIAEECRLELEASIQPVLEDKTLTPDVKIEHLFLQKFKAILRFRNEYPKGKELTAHLYQVYPERRQQWQKLFTRLLQGILDEGVEKGFFTPMDTALTAKMMHLAAAQYLFPAHTELPEEPQQKDLQDMMRWILALLENPKSETGVVGE